MKKINLLYLLFVVAFLFSCTGNKYKTITKTDANGYKYQMVTNDPYNLRIYTLKNGLTVYLSVNKDEPRIQTYIPVKAGSTYDPADNTGLAHYLEHMMFKGTSKMGTVNWEAEKPLIGQISNLYEKHKAATNPEEKKAIYRQIDSLSNIAAQYAAANEYDKLTSVIGATGTNAYTTNERTVYMNNIPSNELEKWLEIESERFPNLVLRLFHTELETVYEEFNMSQDRDGSKAYTALLKEIFPRHPYGQQTTIGKGEHLKNPSMENIMKYYSTYYVPNNMAICLSGDLDQEKTIQLVDKYFGKIPSKEVPVNVLPKEDPIAKIKDTSVYGPQAEFLYMGFRFNGIGTEDKQYVTLIDEILNNRQAGLIDIDLNQSQKVLSAGSGPTFLKEYGYHIFYGYPRQGQTLDEVKDLILAEIQKIKKGEFDEWLPQACINNLRLNEIRAQESNDRSHTFAATFAEGTRWEDYLSFNDKLTKITKQQIVAFANEHYKDNYVVVYKRAGNDTAVMKVEKPELTPIDLKRENVSEFCKNIEAQPTDRLEPEFIDFKEKINSQELVPGVQFDYITNPTNQLFGLYYVIDMGKDHDKKLELAVNYLPYLGTDTYTPAQLQQEFFKYGLSFGVSTGDERSYVYISGLEENAAKGIELLEHVLAHVKADTSAYKDYIDGITKSRLNNKLDKNQILYQAMMNYAMYGPKSNFTNIYSQEQMSQINPEELIGIIKKITSYPHRIFYYGQKSNEDALALIKVQHALPTKLDTIPAPTIYQPVAIDKPVVYFVNYDMVQTMLIMLTKDENLNVSLIPDINVFNEFYGGSMASVVFQEIREAKGLAYSAYSFFSIPNRPGRPHYNYSFVATQADKLMQATEAMKKLLTEMPQADQQFATSKEAIQKQIESERIIKENIYWTWLAAKDKGIDYDIRKANYEKAKTISMDELKLFFDKHISNKQYAYLVIGNKNIVDFKALGKVGPIKELTLEEIFNY